MNNEIKFNAAVNTAKFQSGMAKMRNVSNTTASKIKGAFGGIGAMLAGGALLAGMRSFGNEMDRIGKLAKRLNTTPEDIQRVAYAAKLAGSNLEQMANAFTRGTRKATDFSNSGITKIFKDLKIDQAAFVAAEGDMQKQLLMLAEGFREAGGGAAALQSMFGILEDDAKNLAPLLKMDEDALVSMFNEAGVASNETVASIEKINDAMTQLKSTGTGVMSWLIDSWTEVSARAADYLSGGGGRSGKEIDAEQERKNAIAILKSNEGLPMDFEEGTASKSTGAIATSSALGGGNPIFNFVTGAVKALLEDATQDLVQTDFRNNATAAIDKQVAKQASERRGEAVAEKANRQLEKIKKVRDDKKMGAARAQLLDYAKTEAQANKDQQKAADKLKKATEELAYNREKASGDEDRMAKAEYMRAYNAMIAAGGTTAMAKEAGTMAGYPMQAEAAEKVVPTVSAGPPPAPPISRYQEMVGMQNSLEQQKIMRKADSHAGRGAFGSAQQTLARGRRRAAGNQSRADVMDLIGDKYGAGSVTEAYEEYKDRTNLSRLSLGDFKKRLQERAQSPEGQKAIKQRREEEAVAAGEKAPAKPPLEVLVQSIYEAVSAQADAKNSIQAKLPIPVLVP